MALIYTFPSSIYQLPPPNGDLDEITIQLPAPGATLAVNAPATARFEFRVNSVGLTGVSVRLTMTRHQVLALPPANPISPTGGGWTYTGLLGEASWSIAALANGANVTFEVAYTPILLGAFTYSFSVDAAELRVPASTQVDVSVI